MAQPLYIWLKGPRSLASILVAIDYSLCPGLAVASDYGPCPGLATLRSITASVASADCFDDGGGSCCCSPFSPPSSSFLVLVSFCSSSRPAAQVKMLPRRIPPPPGVSEEESVARNLAFEIEVINLRRTKGGFAKGGARRTGAWGDGRGDGRGEKSRFPSQGVGSPAKG